jgi:hypothetical protein
MVEDSTKWEKLIWSISASQSAVLPSLCFVLRLVRVCIDYERSLVASLAQGIEQCLTGLWIRWPSHI